MFKLLSHLYKKDYLFIGLAILFIAGQVGLELKMPEYMSEITKLVQTQGSAMEDILRNGGMMLLCAFGSLFQRLLLVILFLTWAQTFHSSFAKRFLTKSRISA